MLNLRRSIFITFFSTNMATAIQFGVTIILSRLLTPAEVGIFSITLVFINLIAVFRDFGVTSYLQQEKDLTSDKARSALGLLLTTSWLLAALTFFVRDAIAGFYGQEGIAEVLMVLCISLALVPFASFFYALLARDLQAGKQAIVNTVSSIVYAAVCIVLAYQGFSYMAMAWANVANITVAIVIYLFIRPKDISCWPRFRDWRAPIHFGGGAIIGNLLERIHGSIPDLVLGKLSGPHAVGLYSRANGLIGIFQQIAGPTINYNAMPYLAKNHHAGQPLSPILSRATTYLTAVAWPAFIVTAIFSKEIINVLYGEQWLEAAPIAVLIALQATVRFGYSLTGAALLATGRPYLSAISSGVSIFVRIGLIFLIDAKDLYTFALALCVADILTVIVPAYLMHRYLGYTLRDSLQAHIPSIKLGLICFSLALALKYGLPPNWPDFIKLIITTAVLSIAWTISIVRLHHPLQYELPAIIQRALPQKIASRVCKLLDLERK